MQMNADDSGTRRFVEVQLPEPIVPNNIANPGSKKIAQCAVEFLNSIHKDNRITEIGKERIRRAGARIKAEHPEVDVGFRVFKLDSSNVKVWNPQAEDLVAAMESHGEHLVSGRTEEDFLTEILLKSGIDLCEDAELREIAGHKVYSLGYGQYYACTDADVAKDVEELALGIAEWHVAEKAAVGGEQADTCTVFVLDSAFQGKDAAKMNFVALLEQHGICNIKAL